MDVTRRRALLAASTAASATLVGCLNDDAASTPGDGAGADDGRNESDGSSDADGEPGDDGGNESDESDDDGGDERDGANGSGLVEYDDRTYSATSGDYRAEVLYSEGAALDAIDDERTSDELESFVAETDFDRSAMLLLQAEGRTLCYGLELESVDVDDDGVTVDARVVDESAPDEGCAQQIHYPTALVRVVFEDAVPRRWDVTITGDDGAVHEFDLDEGSS